MSFAVLPLHWLPAPPRLPFGHSLRPEVITNLTPSCPVPRQGTCWPCRAPAPPAAPHPDLPNTSHGPLQSLSPKNGLDGAQRHEGMKIVTLAHQANAPEFEKYTDFMNFSSLTPYHRIKSRRKL